MIRLAAALAALILATGARAEGNTHYLVLHVDRNVPVAMNLALANAETVTRHYRDQGDEVVIEVVAEGPGLIMFVSSVSPVADRIARLADEMDNLTFSACQTTLDRMAEIAEHEIELLEAAEPVESGIVRLMQLQEQGYSYVKH